MRWPAPTPSTKQRFHGPLDRLVGEIDLSKLSRGKLALQNWHELEEPWFPPHGQKWIGPLAAYQVHVFEGGGSLASLAEAVDSALEQEDVACRLHRGGTKLKSKVVLRDSETPAWTVLDYLAQVLDVEETKEDLDLSGEDLSACLRLSALVLRRDTPRQLAGAPVWRACLARDVSELVREVLRVWRESTAPLSSTQERFDHPAYRILTNMGSEAIPVLAEEIKAGSFDVLPALRELVAEDRPDQDIEGDEEVRQAWLHWSRERTRLS